MAKSKPKTPPPAKPKPNKKPALSQKSLSRLAAALPSKKSKAALIQEALNRPDGATLDELMHATAWQRHSVRGFLSTLGKKPGSYIEKFTRADGSTAYKTSSET